MSRIFNWIQEHPFFAAFLGMIALAIVAYLGLEAAKEREWERYCAEARARGVAITVEEIIPPPVPEAENFAALSLFQGAFAEPSKPVQFIPKPSDKLPGLGDPIRQEPLPWKEWQDHFQTIGWLKERSEEPARDILRALDENAALLTEWNAGLTRPQTRFPLKYEMGMRMPLPHLQIFQDASRVQALRVQTHLELKNGDAALGDWRRGLNGLQKLDKETGLISQLVRISGLNQLLNAVGAGLEQHQWTGPQLRGIMQELAQIDLIHSRQKGYAGDRAFFNGTYELLAKSGQKERERLLAGMNSETKEGYWPLRFIPRRLARDNQIRHNRYIDELTAKADVEKGIIDWNAATPSFSDSPTKAERYYFLIFYLATPAYAQVERRWAHLSAKIDQCRTACALEGFRQAQGKYPEQLGELVPHWLERVPVDPFSNGPMIYRITETGYRLYSVGSNGTDEMGEVVPGQNESKQPDLVWQQIPGRKSYR